MAVVIGAWSAHRGSPVGWFSLGPHEYIDDALRLNGLMADWVLSGNTYEILEYYPHKEYVDDECRDRLRYWQQQYKELENEV